MCSMIIYKAYSNNNKIAYFVNLQLFSIENGTQGLKSGD